MTNLTVAFFCATLSLNQEVMVFPPVLLKKLTSSLCDTEASAAMRTVNRKLSLAINPKKKVPVGDEECGFCGSSDQSLKSCSCRLVCYCSESCQQAHWKAEPFGHKDRCVAPADRKPPAFQSEKSKSDTHSSRDPCGVCFEPLLAENTLKSGHAGTQTLICKHSFHSKCASDLASFSSSPLCPLCRGPFSIMPVETLFLDADKAHDVILAMVSGGHFLWATLPPTMKTRLCVIVRLFFEAANRGHVFAQYSLGVIYEKGQGVKKDDKEAVKWYRQSADQGLAEAQYNLGTMYEKGLGVKQNFKEAAKYYRKAAGQGDVQAQYNLGIMYEKGQGVNAGFQGGSEVFSTSSQSRKC